MSGHMGWEEAVFVVAEETWKTHPGSGQIFYPVTSYGCRYVREFREVRPKTGKRQRVWRKHVRGMVTGQIVTPFYGWTDRAAFFFDAALSAPAGSDLDSFSAEFNTAADDDRIHKGCRINQLTLAGNQGDGVTMTMDIIGAIEVANGSPQSIPDDQHWDDAESADLEDCTYVIDGSPVYFEDFSLVVNNQLKPSYQGQRELQSLRNSTRLVDFSGTLEKSGNTYDVLRRTVGKQEVAAQLVVKALDETGANYTTLTIDLGRANFGDNAESGGIDDIIKEGLSYQVLKPDSTDNELEYEFTSVAV